MAKLRLLSRLGISALLLLSACDAYYRDGEVRVVRYEGPPLMWENVYPWSVSERTQDDEITLMMTVEDSLRSSYDIPGLGKGNTAMLTLTEASRDLPRYKDLWIGVPGEWGRVLAEGEIQVQEWNPDGVMSGIIDGTLKGGSPIHLFFRAEADDQD